MVLLRSFAGRPTPRSGSMRRARLVNSTQRIGIVTLTPVQSVVETVGESGLLTGPSKRRNHRGASRPASGGMTAQPQRAAKPGRSVNVWARFVGFARRGCGKILSTFAAAGNWIVHSRRSIATTAACVLVVAAFAPFLYRSDPGERVLHPTASENDTGLKQALRREQERANTLASDVTAARREAESQAALIRKASESADREKEASERALVGLRQALQLELLKTEKLTAQLAEAQRDSAAQTALARKKIDDSARVEEERERLIGELRQALKQQEDKTVQIRREVEGETAQAKQANVRAAEQLALKQEQDKAEELRVELATARRDGELQAETLRSARDEAARIKEASARATDELREALQQAQDKAEKLAGELAVARREVEAKSAVARAAGDETRHAVGTSKQSAEEQSQALREAQGKAEKLATELTAARKEIEAQTAVARVASDEVRRAAEMSKQRADEQGQALREAQSKAEKLATELATARREVQSQVFVASSARDEAAGVKEAAERSSDEQQRALQQERDKTEKLTAELAEARSSLEAQAKAKIAEETARNNLLATVRGELQKANAEATFVQESLAAERTRTQRVEQQLASIREPMPPRGSGSVATASSSVGQPSIAASSVSEAPPKAPTEVVQQPTNLATRPTTGLEQGSAQAVRLIARANLLLEQGNIGAARNILDRAAELGSADALFWLAETYDPLLLSARKTFGTQSDIAKARELYGKALAGGASQAKARLEALQQ